MEKESDKKTIYAASKNWQSTFAVKHLSEVVVKAKLTIGINKKNRTLHYLTTKRFGMCTVTCCKDTTFFWFRNIFIEKIWKTLAENEIVRIFAVSFRGIRRKDDNLYDLNGRYEPQIKTNHHSYVVVLFFVSGLLWYGDAILNQLLGGTLKTDH